MKCHLSLFTCAKESILTVYSQSGSGAGGHPALASWAVRLSDGVRAGGGFDPYWFELVSDTALRGEHDWRQAGRLAAEGRPLCPLHGTFTTAEREGSDGALIERLNLNEEAGRATDRKRERKKKKGNPSHYLNGDYSQLGGLWPTDLSSILSHSTEQMTQQAQRDAGREREGWSVNNVIQYTWVGEVVLYRSFCSLQECLSRGIANNGAPALSEDVVWVKAGSGCHLLCVWFIVSLIQVRECQEPWCCANKYNRSQYPKPQIKGYK